MASLSEELSRLANPTPHFRDPEDNFDDETSAQVLSGLGYYDGSDGEEQPSKLRQHAAVLLSESDVRYQGKKATRKSLEESAFMSEGGEEAMTLQNSSLEDKESSEESEDEGDNSSEEDVDISAFKQQLKLKTSATQGKNGSNIHYEEYDDDAGEMDTDELEEEDEDTDSEGSGERSDGDSGLEKDETMDGAEAVSSFSKTDVSEEIEKGKATKHQISLWDSLLEGRIKLQKCLVCVNQLPQPDTWEKFEETGVDNFIESSKQCQLAVKTLLDSLIQLQTLLLLNNPETKHVVDRQDGKSSTVENHSDDEVITSDSETEEQKPAHQKKLLILSKNVLKRKLETDEYPEFLAKRHKDFENFRNNTIQKWNDKTRLATGKLRSKSFSAFDQSALKQIEQIMADKERLVKRTQLKRSVYKILGKEETADKEKVTGINTETENDTIKEDSTKNHDEEIFDDDDFYHQLLRELIERKTSDVSDPVALSRQWLEIQRLRTKVKKKVDTKASKGRKLRYDVHKKLLNFMAPVDHSTWPEESRDDLYRSLFGKRFEAVTPRTENT